MSSTLIEPRYYHQDLVVPANTPVAAPVSATSPTPNVNLDSVVVRVPAGCAGLVGFNIVLSQEAIIPYGSPPTWFVLDDDEVTLTAGYVVDSTLMFLAYNLDVYGHTFHLDWVAQDVNTAAAASTPSAAAAAPIQAGQLTLISAPLMPAPVTTS